VIEYAIFSMG